MPGSDGEAIFGSTHHPDGMPVATVLLAHGFKGYKDYGMFPALARILSQAGCIAHRFNFSHSGMTGRTETFERPDLFRKDTWNKQVEDLEALAGAIRADTLPGGGLPLVLLGHSRGGVTVLLAAGRHVGNDTFPDLAGVIALATPSDCNRMTPSQMAILRKEGTLRSPSARTKQVLYVDAAFLDDQEAHPAAHDLAALVAGIDPGVPILLVHGTRDRTVSASEAEAIAGFRDEGIEVVLVEGADHVFCTPNPFPVDGAPGPALAALTVACTSRISSWCGPGSR